jgi:hypothetical protein
LSNSSTKSSGVSFLGLLAIVFITLKLVGVSAVATWSWWWVVSPLWIPLAIFLTVVSPLWIPLAIFLTVVIVTCIIAGLVAIFAK